MLATMIVFMIERVQVLLTGAERMDREVIEMGRFVHRKRTSDGIFRVWRTALGTSLF